MVITAIMIMRALLFPPEIIFQTSDQKAGGRHLAMALVLAASNGPMAMCSLLLAAGVDVEERAPNTLFTPLHQAALRGHERIVKLLLSHKADVNSRSKTEATPLHLASQEGHLASVVALLQAGADPLLPRRDGALPIHRAAQHNHTEVVRILIESTKCSPDQVRHVTPLQFKHHRSIAFSYSQKINEIVSIIITLTVSS